MAGLHANANGQLFVNRKTQPPEHNLCTECNSIGGLVLQPVVQKRRRVCALRRDSSLTE